MIEIVKRITKRTCICPKCSCKFSYEDKDIMKDTIDYFKVLRIYVNCPQCNKKVIIQQYENNTSTGKRKGTPKEDYTPLYNCENWIP